MAAIRKPTSAASASAPIAVPGGSVSILGMPAASDSEVRGAVRKGYPFRVLDEVSKRLARPTQEINAVLGIPARTFARRKVTRYFTPEESDRIYRLARTVQLSIDVLGDEEKARAWLGTPNRALGGEVPFGLLDTDIGARQVEAVLLRIAYGIFG